LSFGVAEASLALGAAGAATSAIGTLTKGSADATNAKYQAQVAYNNQIIANQNAAYSAAAGEQRAATVSRTGAARLGSIKASQAASGIDVNSGSAADVQQSERQTGRLSSLTEENNALLQAYGYRAAATGYGAEAGLKTAEAAQAPTGAALAAGGGLLGNASALGYKFNYAGSGSSGDQDFTGGA
jgi:hypothetical protein